MSVEVICSHYGTQTIELATIVLEGYISLLVRTAVWLNGKTCGDVRD